MKASNDATMRVGFDMADPEGTAPIRVVAGHAQRVGAIWTQLGAAMFELADSFDSLIAGGTVELPNPDAHPEADQGEADR